MLVKVRATLVKFTTSKDSKKSADLRMSFSAHRRDACRVGACFRYMLITAVDAIPTMAVFVM